MRVVGLALLIAGLAFVVAGANRDLSIGFEYGRPIAEENGDTLLAIGAVFIGTAIIFLTRRPIREDLGQDSFLNRVLARLTRAMPRGNTSRSRRI